MSHNLENVIAAQRRAEAKAYSMVEHIKTEYSVMFMVKSEIPSTLVTEHDVVNEIVNLTGCVKTVDDIHKKVTINKILNSFELKSYDAAALIAVTNFISVIADKNGCTLQF